MRAVGALNSCMVIRSTPTGLQSSIRAYQRSVPSRSVLTLLAPADVLQILLKGVGIFQFLHVVVGALKI
jgi:hypothetical protein